ncbi:MAG: MATE family efflux transporter [Bacteroidales bacterium]|nr:MATE family efflux transporter [Bacteroidales bacterium]
MAVTGVPTELGTEKVSKLLRQYAVPAIIAMTASSLYNMVDSIFIGHGVGKYAIAGLALTFPMMNLGAAFGALVGVGASATISMLLGQKNYEMAQKVLGNVVTLNLIIGLIYTIVFLIFLDPILYFFGASENTIGYARDYMKVILYGNIITHMYLGLNAVMRSAGLPGKAMMATIFTVIINTVLDPLFIYVFDWGIKGAAWATIIAQTSALIWITRIFSDKNLVIHFKKGIYKLRSRIVKDVISIGMSPFFMNTAACLIVILINQGLQRHGGDLAIGAYGIVNRISFVFVMIVMGLNQGMQPIAGYNFGARQFNRVAGVLKLTILCATVIMTIGFIVAELFPRLLVMVFTTDEELIQQSINGMRIVFMMFPIIGFQMVTSNFFQSVGMAGKAIFLSLTRQLLFLLPCLLILPHFFQTNGIWMSMPAADALASIVSFFMLYSQIKKFKTAGEHEK